MSSVQRTLKVLRSLGYVCAVCEKWNPHVKIRQDLFGFIDIICLQPNVLGVLAIQVTTHSNISSHRHKLASNKNIRMWLLTGNKVDIISWGKQGSRGKRKVWKMKRESISLEDICSMSVEEK